MKMHLWILVAAFGLLSGCAVADFLGGVDSTTGLPKEGPAPAEQAGNILNYWLPGIGALLSGGVAVYKHARAKQYLAAAVEAKQVLEAALDTNKDGKVDAEEVKAALARLNLSK